MDNFINFQNYPSLDVGNRNGATDYIDYLKWDDVKHPVMTGVDKFKRKFIVVKMKVGSAKVMQTFFQRYTGGTLWMPCGHATDLLLNVRRMTDNDFKLIKNIIEGKTITLDFDEHSYDSVHKKGDSISLLE